MLNFEEILDQYILNSIEYMLNDCIDSMHDMESCASQLDVFLDGQELSTYVAKNCVFTYEDRYIELAKQKVLENLHWLSVEDMLRYDWEVPYHKW